MVRRWEEDPSCGQMKCESVATLERPPPPSVSAHCVVTEAARLEGTQTQVSKYAPTCWSAGLRSTAYNTRLLRLLWVLTCCSPRTPGAGNGAAPQPGRAGKVSDETIITMEAPHNIIRSESSEI